MSSKLIVILGATGNQGGSVAEAFLSEPGWKVRALTRNTSSAKAKALSSKGAEVVQADLDDPSSLNSAFGGAHAIFAVSDFWGLYYNESNRSKTKPGQALNDWAAQHEEQQLKNVIDIAAKIPTLERFILSSLSHSEKWSKGKYTRVYHFDGKARATEYAQREHPDLWAKTSVYQAGLFLSNFVLLPPNQPFKNADGVAQFVSTLEVDTKFPYIAPEEDTGPFVKALIIDEPAGHNLIAYREWLSANDIAAAFTKATGIPSKAIKDDGAIPPGISDELLGEMIDCFSYFNEFGYEGRDDPTVVHPRDLKFAPKLSTAEEYLKKQDWTRVFGS
ncbi:hypothetical protein ACKRZS_002479 [Fusarium odoratissimum]